MNEKIFINYRKDDSPWNSVALYQELLKYFPKGNVFKDFNTIAPGTDFVESIEKALEECDVLLVLISKNWLNITDSKGIKRIYADDDFVRLEIATALKRNIYVIPVLFDDAILPQADELPEDLKKLSRRQSIEIDKTRFDTDTARLVEAIKSLFPTPVPERLPQPLASDDGAGKKKKIPWLNIISIAIVILAVISIVVYKSINGSGQPSKVQNDVNGKIVEDTLLPVDKKTETGKKGKENGEKVVPGSAPKDFDGNVYDVVVIGTQTWMKENLKTTHYRNGTAIPEVTDNTAWANLSTGAYSNLNNDASNANTYGLLYNWYAVKNSAGLCPQGWHIPTDQNWRTLIDFSGGDNAAGTGLKAKILWEKFGEVPNDLTNSSGFSGIPAGERWPKGDFANGNWAYIWSSSFNVLGLNYNNTKAYLIRGSNQTENSGYSCRCIKD